MKFLVSVFLVFHFLFWGLSAKTPDIYKSYLVDSSFVAGSFMVDDVVKKQNIKSIMKLNRAAEQAGFDRNGIQQALIPIQNEHLQFAWRPIFILPDVFGRLKSQNHLGLAVSTFFGCVIFMNYDVLRKYDEQSFTNYNHTETTFHHELMHCYDYRHSPEKSSLMYWRSNSSQQSGYSYIRYVKDLVRLYEAFSFRGIFTTNEEEKDDED